MRRVPLLLVVVLLLVSGLLVQPAEGIPHQDKLHHVIGFFCLALALRMGFPRLNFAAFMALILAAACSVEMGQALRPARTSSIADIAAGLSGGLLGWSIGWCLQRWWQAQSRRGNGGDEIEVAGEDG